MSRRPSFAATAAIVLAAAILVTPVRAQEGPAPYLPIGTWEAELVERLRNRGLLPALHSLERPYRADEVSAALAEIDPRELRALERTWYDRLGAALERRPRRVAGGVGLRLSAEPGVEAGSSANRDPLFEWGNRGAWTRLELEAAATAGPVTLHVMPRLWQRPTDDPRYFGGKEWFGQDVAYREETSYITAGSGRFQLFAGRLARSWGPDPDHSLNLGATEYTYDQLAWNLELGPFRFTQLLGHLDRFGGRRRYLFGHRVAGRAGPALDLAVTRSHVASRSGWVELADLNPIAGGESNVFTTLDVAWRPYPETTVFAQLLRDDPVDGHASGALHIGARDAGTVEWLDLEASYTLVAAQTYRPRADFTDLYTYWNTSLGWDRSDFDRIAVKATVYPNEDARLSGSYMRVRQGPGDPRSLRGEARSPSWLNPPNQVMNRYAVDGRLRVGPGGQLVFDLGWIDRDLRAFERGVTSGWAFDGWIQYSHRFDFFSILGGDGRGDAAND